MRSGFLQVGGHRDAQVFHLEFGPQVSKQRKSIIVVKKICYAVMLMLVQLMHVPTTYSKKEEKTLSYLIA